MLEILLEFMLKTLKSVIVENYLYNLCGKLVIELVLYMLHRFIAGGGILIDLLLTNRNILSD